jgi:hypothetical protein
MAALTELQTKVLSMLTATPSAVPQQTLTAIYRYLVFRAGASDEDTIFHVELMIERGLVRLDQLPPSIHSLTKYGE